MNVATNILLLSLLTLFASRHVHAYRIARRRRTGARTTFRHTTSESASTSMPQCDPTTCCSINTCLKYVIQPEKLCQGKQEQNKFQRDSILPDSTWPFINQNSASGLRFPPFWLPASSSPISSSKLSSSRYHHDDFPIIQLTEEQEFIARTYYSRFFRRRDQLPPIPNDSNPDSPSILSKRTSDGARSKRSLSYVCPRNEQWEDVMLAINADDQLVQMVQLSDSRQWLLTESCQYTQSPTVSNVICQEVTRLVPAVVVDSVTSEVQHQFIKVHCCVGIKVD
ncbi:uncharacterized protein LOC129262363 [Lytechinus pictus]|uniref:uncharacterized protein LOC129262363 n=1 Tax=Lytechinus pictus TaxID=7653 RepID=UPI00240D193D|nr:uncharacterized protein LOC129262363 [Lytechinus pictus]